MLDVIFYWKNFLLVTAATQASQAAMKYQLLKLKVIHMNVQDHDGRSSVNLCSDSGCRVVFSPSNSRFGKVVTHFLIPLPKEMPGQSSGCTWPSRIDLHPDKGRDSLSCQMTWYS